MVAQKPWGVSPHNADAECDVLGCVMLQPSCLDIVATMLKPDDFFDADRRTIFEAMLSLRSRKFQLVDSSLLIHLAWRH